MPKVFLSVVIPSYNETENLRRGVLGEVRDYLQKQKYTWEVIVSDDGSPEIESRNLAKDFCSKNEGFSFLENEHGGKPLAVWAGVRAAKGEIILFTDMDQSAPIAEVEKLLPYFNSCFEVVIGSRGKERKNFSIFRLLASTVFREFRRTIILRDIIDTQAGFKAFSKTAAMAVFPKLEAIRKSAEKTAGWTVGSWDAELLFVAEKFGYKVKEVPILWENRDVSTGKKSGGSRFVKESLEMLQQILRVRINDFRGFYDK